MEIKNIFENQLKEQINMINDVSKNAYKAGYDAGVRDANAEDLKGLDKIGKILEGKENVFSNEAYKIQNEIDDENNFSRCCGVEKGLFGRCKNCGEQS